MAVSNIPAYGFTLTCPDAATLVDTGDVTYGVNALAVPDNCASIVVYNMDAANRVFVRFGRLGEISVANTTVNTSTVLPALGSMTFQVGFVGDREYMGAGYPTRLFLLPEAGAAVLVNVTYLMGRGSNIL